MQRYVVVRVCVYDIKLISAPVRWSPIGRCRGDYAPTCSSARQRSCSCRAAARRRSRRHGSARHRRRGALRKRARTLHRHTSMLLQRPRSHPTRPHSNIHAITIVKREGMVDCKSRRLQPTYQRGYVATAWFAERPGRATSRSAGGPTDRL